MVQNDLRRLSKRFNKTVGAGESGEQTEELQADATIERCDVRFYTGPRLDLELRPFIENERSRRTLPDLIGREVVVGEDDEITFHVSEPVERGDVIGVEFVNQDGSNAYDYHVDMLLDRAGGSRRMFPGDSDGS